MKRFQNEGRALGHNSTAAEIERYTSIQGNTEWYFDQYSKLKVQLKSQNCFVFFFAGKYELFLKLFLMLKGK